MELCECPECGEMAVIAVLLDRYTSEFETAPVLADKSVPSLSEQYTYVGAFCAACESHVPVLPSNL